MGFKPYNIQYVDFTAKARLGDEDPLPPNSTIVITLDLPPINSWINGLPEPLKSFMQAISQPQIWVRDWCAKTFSWIVTNKFRDVSVERVEIRDDKMYITLKTGGNPRKIADFDINEIEDPFRTDISRVEIRGEWREGKATISATVYGVMPEIAVGETPIPNVNVEFYVNGVYRDTVQTDGSGVAKYVVETNQNIAVKAKCNGVWSKEILITVPITPPPPPPQPEDKAYLLLNIFDKDTRRPIRAKLYLDGKYVGYNSYFDLDISVGAHVVRVVKDGYRDKIISFNASKDQQIDIDVYLEKAKACIYVKNFIDSEPVEAKVYLNDSYVGKFREKRLYVSPGRYTVKAYYEDQEKYSYIDWINDGETVEINFRFRKLVTYGYIHVYTNRDDDLYDLLNVYIDGEFRGTSPLTVRVSPGKHRVKVSCMYDPATYSQEKTVDVEANKTTDVFFDFSMVPYFLGGPAVPVIVKYIVSGIIITILGTILWLAVRQYFVEMVGKIRASIVSYIDKIVVRSRVVPGKPTSVFTIYGRDLKSDTLSVPIFDLLEIHGHTEIIFGDRGLTIHVKRTPFVDSGFTTYLPPEIPIFLPGKMQLWSVTWFDVYISDQGFKAEPVGEEDVEVKIVDVYGMEVTHKVGRRYYWKAWRGVIAPTGVTFKVIGMPSFRISFPGFTQPIKPSRPAFELNISALPISFDIKNVEFPSSVYPRQTIHVSGKIEGVDPITGGPTPIGNYTVRIGFPETRKYWTTSTDESGCFSIDIVAPEISKDYILEVRAEADVGYAFIMGYGTWAYIASPKVKQYSLTVKPMGVSSRLRILKDGEEYTSIEVVEGTPVKCELSLLKILDDRTVPFTVEDTPISVDIKNYASDVRVDVVNGVGVLQFTVKAPATPTGEKRSLNINVEKVVLRKGTPYETEVSYISRDPPEGITIISKPTPAPPKRVPSISLVSVDLASRKIGASFDRLDLKQNNTYVFAMYVVNVVKDRRYRLSISVSWNGGASKEAVGEEDGFFVWPFRLVIGNANLRPGKYKKIGEITLTLIDLDEGKTYSKRVPVYVWG